jgi:hypothetical protein
VSAALFTQRCCLPRGVAAPRWSPEGRKILGKKAPTLVNVVKSLFKLTQRAFDELCKTGAVSSKHGSVTNRTQATLRVSFLQHCHDDTLTALQRFESKRALLGLGHTESPITNTFLVGGSHSETALHLDTTGSEPWRTPQWQRECVRILEDRFFTRNQTKPVESAEVLAHVARVFQGVEASMQQFASSCDDRILPKALDRLELLRNGESPPNGIVCGTTTRPENSSLRNGD